MVWQGADMEQFITEIINNYGYLGIFLLITLENVFPPIPSEVILLFGGFLTTCSTLTVGGEILVSTLGSVAGAGVLYFLGYVLGEERIENIIVRWGHIIRLGRKDFQRANQWFERYGVRTVFFCRLVPILRSLVSIPAGITKMQFGKFLLYTVAGTLIWNSILVSVGAAVGASWKTVVVYWDLYSKAVFVILGLLLLLLVIRIFVKRR